MFVLFTPVLFFYGPVAYAKFTFTTNTPTFCQPLQVDWDGGQAPFSLTIFSVNSTQRTISIPDGIFSNGKGSLQTSFPIEPNNPKFVVVMSDATGFAAGGVSPLISAGEDGCAVSNPAPAFFWGGQNTTQDVAQQCSQYQFQIETSNVNMQLAFPVTIYVIVPGGTLETFTMNQSSFTIPSLNVPAGTDILFALADTQQRSGGVSDLTRVVTSADRSCLSGAFLSSTSPPSSDPTVAVIIFSKDPSGTLSPTPTPTPSSIALPIPSSTPSSLSVGAIGGIAAGGGALAIMTIAAIFFLYRKRRRQGLVREKIDLDEPLELRSSLGSNYATVPFTGPYTYGVRHFDPSQYSASVKSRSPRPQQRYVIHTDAADVRQELGAVIELPPQYNENRPRIPGLEQS